MCRHQDGHAEPVIGRRFAPTRWLCLPLLLRVSADFQLHPVIARHHALRQALPQHLVIEVGVHVGDDRALRLEAVDPGQRVVDAEMAGMGGVTKAVDDPEIEIFEERPALAPDVAEVRRIGGIRDTKAERRYLAVLEQEGGEFDRAALPFGGVALAGLDRMTRQDRRIVAALRGDEAVGEPRHDVLGGRLVEIDGNSTALMQHHRPQIVDAMGLVGVLMGKIHGVDVIDVGIDQLLAQIGRGVDHDPRRTVRAGPFDQKRATAAAILGILGIAGAPAERRTGDAGGGAAAKDRERQCHAAMAAGTFENRRKKFSVVCREISSSETPRASASTFATSTTYAGSLRLPRNFPGARYGASVSTMMRSAGSSAASARKSSDFLNVRMPVNEIDRPSSIAFIASSRPPV